MSSSRPVPFLTLLELGKEGGLELNLVIGEFVCGNFLQVAQW